MSFDKEGFTTVDVRYHSGFAGEGASWIAVPGNFTETTVTPLTGTLTSIARLPYRLGGSGGAHPFYDNLTFTYDSPDEPFTMRISYNMSNGAIIVEPNGFFFSPQIGVPPTASASASVTFPVGVDLITEASPTPVQTDDSGPRLRLGFSLPSESRIAAAFKVTWAKETSYIQDGIVEAAVPTRYAELGEQIVGLYNRAVPRMNDLFNVTMERISMRFFVPLLLMELGIGGYTPVDPSTFQAGTIYLNLFYSRATSGTLETIAMHELTHQYAASAGIAATLLWVHEGLANYVAVQMGPQLGYDSSFSDADLEASASELKGDYGFVQDWQPETTTFSLYQYYAASYKIFKTLGDEYGGLTFYRTFFRGLHDLKGGLKSTNAAIYKLGVAANANLFPVFAQWKFDVVDLTTLSAEIARLRAKAQFYGPLLPFSDQALSHLDRAESAMYTSPDAALGHVKLAEFYIETVPMIIAGILLTVLIVALLIVTARGRRRTRVEISQHTQA
jgi:hypothetical protein